MVEDDDLDQQVIHLPVVDNAPVARALSPGDVCLATGEEADEALA